MPMLSDFWKKLTTNEKFVMYGAGVAVVAFLIGIAAKASDASVLFAPILITVLYWLKYSSMKISWPVPISTIVLVVAGIAAIVGLISVLGVIDQIGQLHGIAVIVGFVGGVVMAFFAWREYSAAMPKPAAPTGKTPPAA